MRVLMKKQIISLIIKLLINISVLLIFTSPVLARDFIVEFIEENYTETQAKFSYDPLIYHSIQVNSIAGPKVLILTGNDYTYRSWIRNYIAQNKKFITIVPDENADQFISSKAYKIDITSLHPFNGEKWKINATIPQKNIIAGNNNILIVDPNEKRTYLIQTLLKDMGFQSVIFINGEQALKMFKLQPEKFKMIIVQHSILDTPSDNFVDNILKLNHIIPIIIDTGYKNLNIKNKLLSKFSGSQSVHLKSVILKELKDTINSLISNKA
jgi:CheY-like chemotaxis protein